MFPDFLKLLSALNAHKVKYLIVGGYAVSQHAQPRATDRLDQDTGLSEAQNSKSKKSAKKKPGKP